MLLSSESPHGQVGPWAGRSVHLFSRIRKNTSYEDSVTVRVTETISEAARIAAVCYLVDTIEVAMEVTGVKGRRVDISSLIAKLIYATWAFFKVRLYKREFFVSVVESTPKMMSSKGGIVEIFDKVTSSTRPLTQLLHSLVRKLTFCCANLPRSDKRFFLTHNSRPDLDGYPQGQPRKRAVVYLCVGWCRNTVSYSCEPRFGKKGTEW
jgi:hypothetical protein